MRTRADSYSTTLDEGRKPDRLHFRCLLYRRNNDGRFFYLRYGRLQVVEEEVLNLEGGLGNAELSSRNLGQFLVNEHFAGKTEHRTCDGLGMKGNGEMYLFLDRLQGVEDVGRIGGVQRRDDANDLLTVLLGTQHHGIDSQL